LLLKGTLGRDKENRFCEGKEVFRQIPEPVLKKEKWDPTVSFM